MDRPLISLFPLEACADYIIEDSYWRVNRALRLDPALQETSPYYLGTPQNPLRHHTIRDKSRHNIIVFESRDNIQYRNFVYNELNAILTMISYDYWRELGIIPLINMIGHSTGAIWNMMWANRHPHNVSGMYALGSPFNGSDIARYTRTSVTVNSQVRAMIDNPASFDNSDYQQANILRAGWQSAVRQNPNLRLHTLAAESCWYLLAGTGTELGLMFGALLTAVLTGPLLLPPMAFLYTAQAIIVQLFIGAGTLEYILARSRRLYLPPRIVLADDFAVSIASAQAVGFYNPNNNIRRNWSEVFTSSNTNSNMSAHPDMPAIPHGLLTKHVSALNYVVNNITMGALFTYTIRDNQATITGINGTLGSSTTLPEQIRDMYVRNITSNAFINQPYLTNVIIPSGVTSIDAVAMNSGSGIKLKWLNNFESYTNVGQPRVRTLLRFLNKEATTYTVPAFITHIAEEAFLESTHLTEIIVPGSVIFIGDNAFTEHALVRWAGNFEFRGDTIIRYLNNINRQVEIPSVIAGREIRYIGAGAFMGNTNVERVTIPAGIVSIGDDAFSGTIFLFGVVFLDNSSLVSIGNRAFRGTRLRAADITIPPSVTEVGRDVFYGTPIWQAEFSSVGRPVIVNNWLVGVRGAPSSILLPDSVDGIANNALLGWVTIYSELTTRPSSWANLTNPMAFDTAIAMEAAGRFVVSVPRSVNINHIAQPIRYGYRFMGWQRVDDRYNALWIPFPTAPLFYTEYLPFFFSSVTDTQVFYFSNTQEPTNIADSVKNLMPNTEVLWFGTILGYCHYQQLNRWTDLALTHFTSGLVVFEMVTFSTNTYYALFYTFLNVLHMHGLDIRLVLISSVDKYWITSVDCALYNFWSFADFYTSIGLNLLLHTALLDVIDNLEFTGGTTVVIFDGNMFVYRYLIYEYFTYFFGDLAFWDIRILFCFPIYWGQMSGRFAEFMYGELIALEFSCAWQFADYFSNLISRVIIVGTLGGMAPNTYFSPFIFTALLQTTFFCKVRVFIFDPAGIIQGSFYGLNVIPVTP